MRRLLSRWGLRPPCRSIVTRADLRPQLAQAMCPACARRWLAGRSIWHPWCGVELRHAFDLHFERLHKDL
jgi:hypothetical protein